MRARIIIRYVGVSLTLVALMMALSGIVALHNNNDSSTMPLLYSAFLTMIMGLFPTIFVRAESDINVKEGIAIVVLSWIFCCIFGMFPYLCYVGEFTFVDALFESVSGFTTTGASILNNIEALPSGLLFWRASTAWVGGLGIVSLFSLVIPKSMDLKSVLSSAELSDITRSQSSKRGKSFIWTMFLVYVILTAVCAISLKLTGMRWFDAVTNAMSTCSTCGFCVKNSSIAAYGSISVEMIIVAFMTVSGISFMMISSMVRGVRWMSSATKAFLAFLVGASIVITINLMMNGENDLMHTIRLAVFQVCSITTTTGFATADTTIWPSLSIFVLLIASLVCGCSGSTSGGMKMDRVVILSSYIFRGFHRSLHPNQVTRVRVDGKLVSDSLAGETMRFVLLYVALIVAGTSINALGGLDLETGMTAAIACLGNVGPGFGDVGSMGNYADFPALLKLNSAVLMIAGRLEIIPLFSFVNLLMARKS